MIVIPSRENIIDSEDRQAQSATLTVPSTGNVVLTVTAKNARRAFLSFVGMAWDAGLDTFLTWRVKLDGAVMYRLLDSTVQIAPPEQPDKELTPWIEIPQGSTLTFECDVAAGAVAGKATARMKVYYAPINQEG